MSEKDGNKIAVVLTAASAMAAGVSVYTMATSEEGQRVFQPSVLSLENGSEEFHTNYFINEVKKTPKMDDTFLKEAMALANSILAPLGKQQATPLTSEEIVLESTSVTAQDTPQESVEEIRLSGSPMEESQENHPIQPMVPQYVQTSSGPLQVSPITTSTVSVPSPLSREVNSVAMNLETSEFV